MKIGLAFLFFSFLPNIVVTEHTQKKQNGRNNLQGRRKRFNLPTMPKLGGGMSSFMGGGASGPMGMGSGGPFHGGSSPSGGMGRGPGGGMNPGGQTLFNPSHCLQREIMCPQWCVMTDSYGCRSCPCGPGGGMLAGGMGSFMSHMPSIGSQPFSHVTQSSTSQENCIAVNLCKKNCAGAYTLGGTGADGCPSCTCDSHNSLSGISGGVSMSIGGGSVGGSGGGSPFGGGFSGPFSPGVPSLGGGGGGGGDGSSSSASSSTSSGSSTSAKTETGSTGNSVTNNYYYMTTESGGSGVSTMTGVQPTTYTVECRTEEICTDMCGGDYQLGQYTSDGCRSCVCPPKQVVYTQPAVEYTQKPTVQVYQVQCPEMSCSYGCSVGYKCGDDGCPTCECALPSGYTAHQVVVQHQLVCSTSFSCSTRCEIGYRCGNDGCPTCECLVGQTQTVTTGECYDCEWIDFLEPAPQMVEYVRPRPQTPTVYVEKTDSCHDCEETRPQVIYTQPEPRPQTVYVTNTQTCHNCEQPKPQPQIIYERPQPQTQTVYVTEKPRPQTYVVQKPRPQTQTYVVTQPATSHHTSSSYHITGGSSSGGYIMSALTSGHSVGGHGGGIPMAISGGSVSTGGGMAGYSGGGSGSCPPMPHDCHPSCIKYDTPHCRRCECTSSPISGYLHG